MDNKNEKLFFKVFKNNFLRNLIFTNNNHLLYDSINKVSNIFSGYSNAKEIIKDKIKASKYLYLNYSIIFYLIKDEESFYSKLFSHSQYVEQLYDGVLVEAILHKNKSAIKVYLEKFPLSNDKSQSLIQEILSLPSCSSVNILKFLFENFNIKLSNSPPPSSSSSSSSSINPIIDPKDFKKFKSLNYLNQIGIIDDEFLYKLNLNRSLFNSDQSFLLLNENFKFKHLIEICKTIAIILPFYKYEDYNCIKVLSFQQINSLCFTKDQLNSNINKINFTKDQLNSFTILRNMYNLINNKLIKN